MTTPAININQDIPGTYDEYFRYYPTDPWVASGWNPNHLLAGLFNQHRPESMSNPFRADGTRPPGAFYHQKWVASSPLGTFEYGAPGGAEYRLIGSITPPVDRFEVFSGYSENLKDKALLKALLAIKDQKLDLGVALAEARKTAELLGKTGVHLADSLEEFFQKNYKRVGRMNSWKKIPSAFLQWSYGAVPLLNDVYGAAQALAESQNRGLSLNLTASGRAKDTLELEIGKSMFPLKSTYTIRVKENHHFKLVFELPSNILSDFSSLGLTNPLSVAWEVVPYSFVIDWLLPIGDWVSALDAGNFLTYREGSHSVIQRASGEGPVGLEPGVSGYSLNSVGGRPGKCDGMMFNRYPYWVLPVLPPLPQLRNPLSLDKMAKGLALLSQVFKRWS